VHLIVWLVADLLRHALPLVPLYWFHGNLASYTILTAYDLSLGLWLIVVTTRARGDVNSVDPRSRWMVFQILSVLVAAVFLGVLAAIVTIPIGMPAYFFGLKAGIDWTEVMLQPDFWVPVVAMSLLAATRFQVSFYQRTTAGAFGQPTNTGPVLGNLDADRRESLAAQAAQVTLIGTFVFLCYVLIVFGSRGLFVLPVLYAAALMFYDVRPDLAQKIFPPLWQKTEAATKPRKTPPVRGRRPSR
jgi:hypothetical protein